jgi:protocatechuate 3,4-dioxygenase beta subunit
MSMDSPGEGPRLRRREALVVLGGVSLGAVLAASRAADAAARHAAAVATGTARTTVPRCVLTPEQTEGPYWVDNSLYRRNVTEGRPGLPLVLRLTVVNASTCRPIRGADVEIWHADAGGAYSGFDATTGAGPGGGASPTSTRFMRGHQRTGRGGVAGFTTIYPGWYAGRTPHIHVKVHVGGSVVHTGQLYFSDPISDAVYARPPYSARGHRDRTNATDPIYADGGRRSTLRLTRRASGTGYTGSLTLGVRR